MFARIAVFAVVLLSLGCGSSSAGDAVATGAGAGGDAAAGGSAGSGGIGGAGVGGAGMGGSMPGYEASGPSPVGHTSFVLTDTQRGRTLPIEVWYPADESARGAATTGTALEDMEAPGPRHDTLAALVAAAPVPCTRKRTASAAYVPLAALGPLPVIAFSHCSGCTRYTSALLAEHLASRGFAVIAPDHVGNTLWDAMMGMNANIDAPFLALRAGDIRFAVDQLLDASNTDIPELLRGHLDGTRVGVYGHSFGALTTGLVLDLDPRFLAGFAIAAPMQLLEPTRLADVHAPVFFLLAKEDHSIGDLGNSVIKGNFMDANPPAWLAEVEDTGHYSFSDVAGLVDSWPQGCGTAKRQTGAHDMFTYLDNDVARSLAAGYLAAFFERHLHGDTAANAYLSTAHPDGIVTVTTR